MANLAQNSETNNTETQIKTIDIQAKEWFDKVNGNSYFAGTVTVNYGMQDEKEFKMPFQYGYGSQYEQEALSILKNENLIPTRHTPEFKAMGIILRSNIQKNCKKSELKAI